jgi:acyl-[acyl carrier protein]--UDP-N-acetylglucosamine O-acyltransferase
MFSNVFSDVIKNTFKKFLLVISFLLPWMAKRWLLQVFFGYKIDPTAHIGMSWVFPRFLIMEANSKIGNLTVCKSLDLIHLQDSAIIGNGNWITGLPSSPIEFFGDHNERKPHLIVGKHSAITSRHFIDCSDAVIIGNFSTIAGFNSQILSHSISLEMCKQTAAPVTIGDYCFVGTNCVLLQDSALPDYSVLGAKSLLNKKYLKSHILYAGVPARAVKYLPKEYLYFSRTTGYVN